MEYVSKTTHDGRNVRVRDYKKSIKRNRRRRKILFFSFLLFCILLFLHLSPIFDIKAIKCIGSEIVSEDEIISASTLSFDYNIFRASMRKAQKGIESSIPYIKSAKVKRKIPNKIEIKVTECTVAGYLPLNEGYIYIDENCKMLEFNNSPPPRQVPIIQNTGVITFEAGKRLLPDDGKKAEALEGFFKIAQTNDLLGKITVIDIVQPDRLTLIYDNTLEIFIGDSRKLDYKINFAVRTILERLGDNPRGFLVVSNPEYGSVYREKK